METAITNELLHHSGWRSWVNDDEGYFTFEDITLFYDPTNDIWVFDGHHKTFKTWEEFLDIYKEITGKDFISEAAIDPENYFMLSFE